MLQESSPLSDTPHDSLILHIFLAFGHDRNQCDLCITDIPHDIIIFTCSSIRTRQKPMQFVYDIVFIFMLANLLCGFIHCMFTY